MPDRGHLLLAQVIDPGRNTRTASSWVNADHFEIWMEIRDDDPSPDRLWQLGVPLDEGPVQVGYGNQPEPPGTLLKALISTGNIESGNPMPLGGPGTGMIGSVKGNCLSCTAVKRLLEITGAPKSPIVIDGPAPSASR